MGVVEVVGGRFGVKMGGGRCGLLGDKTGGGLGGEDDVGAGSAGEELVGDCSVDKVVIVSDAVLVHPTSPAVLVFSVWLGDGRGCVCNNPILLPTIVQLASDRRTYTNSCCCCRSWSGVVEKG